MKISRYDNVVMTEEGNQLVIRVNTDETEVDVQPSRSGKTLVVATTGGAAKINGLFVNLTVYKK